MADFMDGVDLKTIRRFFRLHNADHVLAQACNIAETMVQKFPVAGSRRARSIIDPADLATFQMTESRMFFLSYLAGYAASIRERDGSTDTHRFSWEGVPIV